MLTCATFLDGYSEFRDSILSDAEMTAFQDHLDECPACARYDRVISGGVSVFRSLPDVCVSDDFEARLQHRIWHLEEARRSGRDGSGAPMAITLGIAAAIGAVAWLPALRAEPEPYRLPPVVAVAPQEPEVVPLLFRTGPLLVDLPAPTPGVYPEDFLFPRYASLGTFPVNATPVFTTVAR